MKNDGIAVVDGRCSDRAFLSVENGYRLTPYPRIMDRVGQAHFVHIRPCYATDAHL